MCNTVQLSEKVIFRVSPFCQVVRKHTLFEVHAGGIVKRLLIAYFIGNISAKKYQNLFKRVKVIASQGGTCFKTRVVLEVCQ